MSLQELFNPIGSWMVNVFGYTHAIHIKDSMSIVMIFILGMITMAFFSSSFILRLHSIEDFGKSKVKLVRIDNNKKSKLTLSIPDIWSAFEVLLFLSFSSFCTINRFTRRDARRTRKFVHFIEIVVLVIIVLTLFFNSVILTPS